MVRNLFAKRSGKMKMSDADRTQILNACQFLRDHSYSLVDSDEYSLDLSDGVHTFAIAYDRYYSRLT